MQIAGVLPANDHFISFFNCCNKTAPRQQARDEKSASDDDREGAMVVGV